MGQLASLVREDELNSGVNFVPRDSSDFGDILILFMNIYRGKNQSFHIPSHLIASIFQYGEICAHTVTVNNTYLVGRNNQDDLYLSQKLSVQKHFRPYNIIIEVDSHDQGWSSYPEDRGTRNGSYTWGELNISSEPTVREFVYRNIHASSAWERQQKIFLRNSDLIIRLQNVLDNRTVNDDDTSLQLYVRSAYPGWCNFIRYASISVAWTINLRFIDEVIDIIQKRKL